MALRRLLDHVRILDSRLLFESFRGSGAFRSSSSLSSFVVHHLHKKVHVRRTSACMAALWHFLLLSLTADSLSTLYQHPSWYSQQGCFRCFCETKRLAYESLQIRSLIPHLTIALPKFCNQE